jgi:LPPG:FO 2-phospho-L-lactate transferase
MADEPVRTEVRTDEGWLEFQDYFVRLHQEPEVREIRFRGAESAHVTPEVAGALGAADVVVIGPSNPFVSVRPILAVPGMADTLADARGGGARGRGARDRGVPVVAVSGIVGGHAIKGPADRMLASLGHEATALGVARIYASLADAFVLDRQDADLADAVAALGLRVVVTDTIMTDDASRARLAREVLAAAGSP